MTSGLWCSPSCVALDGFQKNCALNSHFCVLVFVRRPEHPVWAGRDARFYQAICQRPLFPGGSADFGRAWAKLQSSGAPFAEEAYAPAAQEILAKHIIMAAQRGERNPRRLTDDALLHLSRQRLGKKLPA